ncbi:leucine-rich repeat extensin-like protein 3 [Cannabis sativa]|uniref:leucine-rich repeat extensin-like protein 3 n=1 Tax=Cannabis sativa TaxID=3483 RepID=UPI0029CA4EBA|nr:leucine-rich repeat extensin-like protein 3 [Cannabis sativa]
MESKRRSQHSKMSILIAYLVAVSATTFFIQCEGRKYAEKAKEGKTYVGIQNHLNIGEPLDYSSFEFETFEASSPFSLPPYSSPSPQNSPPFLAFPPLSPQTPSSIPTPPPPGPTPPINLPLPPTPPAPLSVPVPPPYGPSPPKSGPSPSPPQLNTPPMTYPVGPVPPPPPSSSGPNNGTPPDHKKPQSAVWCVGKPTVPDSIMQPALDYACGTGADCKSIQPNGPCYLPNTLLAHASYAFNSYFQKAKLAGGTCDFGGTAMIVTDDPSFEGCSFIYK